MSDIQQYWINPDGITPEAVPNGQWVRFVDHIADRKADKERIAELEEYRDALEKTIKLFATRIQKHSATIKKLARMIPAQAQEDSDHE